MVSPHPYQALRAGSCRWLVKARDGKAPKRARRGLGPLRGLGPADSAGAAATGGLLALAQAPGYGGQGVCRGSRAVRWAFQPLGVPVSHGLLAVGCCQLSRLSRSLGSGAVPSSVVIRQSAISASSPVSQQHRFSTKTPDIPSPASPSSSLVVASEGRTPAGIPDPPPTVERGPCKHHQPTRAPPVHDDVDADDPALASSIAHDPAPSPTGLPFVSTHYTLQHLRIPQDLIHSRAPPRSKEHAGNPHRW